MTITGDLWIEDILEKYPHIQDYLSAKGIVCVKCGEPVWGTLADLLKDKNYSESEIENIIIEINEYKNR